MSLIFATQLTAVATAVLAAFAIVTAWYAPKAFVKQSKEVSDQASTLEIQSGQLAGQRNVNAEQIRVLALRAPNSASRSKRASARQRSAETHKRHRSRSR
jgi:ABC-type protease/lipase transport system fused ATPase/permease subunit